MNVDGDDNMTS